MQRQRAFLSSLLPWPWWLSLSTQRGDHLTSQGPFFKHALFITCFQSVKRYQSQRRHAQKRFINKSKVDGCFFPGSVHNLFLYADPSCFYKHKFHYTNARIHQIYAISDIKTFNIGDQQDCFDIICRVYLFFINFFVMQVPQNKAKSHSRLRATRKKTQWS